MAGQTYEPPVQHLAAPLFFIDHAVALSLHACGRPLTRAYLLLEACSGIGTRSNILTINSETKMHPRNAVMIGTLAGFLLGMTFQALVVPCLLGSCGSHGTLIVPTDQEPQAVTK
jgi:cytochrome c biogenesis protein CcdA